MGRFKRGWVVWDRSIGHGEVIANFELRISDLQNHRVRSQESESRIQEKNKQV